MVPFAVSEEVDAIKDHVLTVLAKFIPTVGHNDVVTVVVILDAHYIVITEYIFQELLLPSLVSKRQEDASLLDAHINGFCLGGTAGAEYNAYDGTLQCVFLL